MKYLLCSHKISKKASRTLIEYGFSLCLLPDCASLSAPVAAHADMLFFVTDDVVVTAREYAASLPFSLSGVCGGREIILRKEPLGALYPADVPLNALPLGRYLFGNAKSVAPEITEYAARHGIETVNVAQGYAACSVLTVSESALVTADRGIADAARERGFDVLLTAPGGIALAGLSYGFIGGASGVCGDDIFFCGDLLSHPDGGRIREFAASHGKRCVSLSDEPLTDIGGIKFL